MSTEITAADEQQGKVANRTKKEISDLSSMLLPMQGFSLLLPGVSVAEIVTFVPPEQEYNEGTPSWFLGTIFWRNQRVPLVSYEGLTTGEHPLVSTHCRIAVMNNTGLSQQLNFFAILLQGTPRLLRLSPDEITENQGKFPEPGQKMHVLVNGEEATVPDIAFIERAVINQLELA